VNRAPGKQVIAADVIEMVMGVYDTRLGDPKPARRLFDVAQPKSGIEQRRLITVHDQERVHMYRLGD
jgi:hypothetical protein